MKNVEISSVKFIAFCLAIALSIIWAGQHHVLSSLVIGAEVFLAVISLFVFGSFRYRIDKNAITYGAALIVSATFLTGWQPKASLGLVISRNFFSLQALENWIHADTMLFILGLTFFVSVIAQTKILETVSMVVLRRNKGSVLPTVALLTGIVSVASGVMAGVSMIGIMIRTLVFILFLAKIEDEAIIFSVIISTVITTVCGMWFAYGEPPNLIMKSNLDPYLTNGFFLRYCLPAAIGSYGIVYWNLQKRLKGRQVPLERLEMSGPHAADEIQFNRIRSQWIGGLSFVPFIGFLIWHGMDSKVPLFWSSFVGLAFALLGIMPHWKIVRRAFREATHEYKEYLFLFPLFFSIALLQKSGFFDGLSDLIRHGIAVLGHGVMASIQFIGTCFLSALLDNNVVADFASRPLRGLEAQVIHLFSMAQIAGYAAGGCLTHIGSAQSVIAYAFIHKEIDKHYTPIQWIRAMTPVIMEICGVMLVLIFIESALWKFLQ